jgi:hypothetical protein
MALREFANLVNMCESNLLFCLHEALADKGLPMLLGDRS